MDNSVYLPLIDRLNSVIDTHFNNQEYEEVLEDIRAIFPSLGIMTFKYFNKALGSYEQVVKNKDLKIKYKDYSLSLSTPLMKKASNIVEAMLSKTGTKRCLLDDFSSIINEIFIDADVKDVYMSSFTLLIDAMSDNNTFISDDDFNEKPEHDHFLITSGYGWSGSGAVTDFLKEFNNVKIICGEVGIFESVRGFTYFVRNITDRETLIRHSLEFFFIHFLGCYPMISLLMLKTLSYANQVLLKSTDLLKYANYVKKITCVLAAIIVECNHDFNSDRVSQLLKLLSQRLLDLVAIDIPNDTIPVIDNCIHTYNIDVINYINNTKLICCCRDPRSIYLSRIKECSGFVRNSLDFVRNQKKVWERINLSKSKLFPSSQNKLMFINFEDFVLNDSFRKDLIKNLGLSLDMWDKKEKYFKPNESSVNVKNFINCDDDEIKKDIQFIADELKEYCLDIE